MRNIRQEQRPASLRPTSPTMHFTGRAEASRRVHHRPLSLVHFPDGDLDRRRHEGQISRKTTTYTEKQQI